MLESSHVTCFEMFRTSESVDVERSTCRHEAQHLQEQASLRYGVLPGDHGVGRRHDRSCGVHSIPSPSDYSAAGGLTIVMVPVSAATFRR